LRQPAELVADGVQSIAIAFLHSYRNPEHEERAAELVREAFPNISVSVSSAITREYREVERTATAVLDAYIRPIFDAYIGELKRGLAANGFDGRFFVMRSGGGVMLAELAARVPITRYVGSRRRIMGATKNSARSRPLRLLSLDYGGTSLDAAVIENGEPLIMYEATLEHFPVLMADFRYPLYRRGRGLHCLVAARSVASRAAKPGAVPGPLAYGRGGTEPTTTDAAWYWVI